MNKKWLLLVLFVPALQAKTYIQPEDHIRAAFAGHPPAASVLWITNQIKEDINKILGHSYHKLRVKFWEKSGKTLWILDEIGREKYITTGIMVNHRSQVEDVTVLAFRESRGWEVKYEFFTSQFNGVTQKPNMALSKNVDAITGATLSTNALKRQVRMALYLHANRKK